MWYTNHTGAIDVLIRYPIPSKSMWSQESFQLELNHHSAMDSTPDTVDLIEPTNTQQVGQVHLDSTQSRPELSATAASHRLCRLHHATTSLIASRHDDHLESSPSHIGHSTCSFIQFKQQKKTTNGWAHYFGDALRVPLWVHSSPVGTHPVPLLPPFYCFFVWLWNNNNLPIQQTFCCSPIVHMLFISFA